MEAAKIFMDSQCKAKIFLWIRNVKTTYYWPGSREDFLWIRNVNRRFTGLEVARWQLRNVNRRFTGLEVA